MDPFKAHLSRTSVTDAADSAPEKGALISFSHQLPSLKQIEQLLIDEALKRANNNQSIAALSLGISRQALNKRLRKQAEQQSAS
jgi:transcriptional regulator with PAS, ATPase and Fis domain